jgi:hypothetical protein
LGAQMSTSGHDPQSWAAEASNLASRLDDSLASVQKGNYSSYVNDHHTANLGRQQSPYSLAQNIPWHPDSVVLSLLYTLKACTACKILTKPARSGILQICRITKAVFLLPPASGVLDHQMHVRGSIGSGIPAGMICTKTSAIGRDACNFDTNKLVFGLEVGNGVHEAPPSCFRSVKLLPSRLL